jgi:hypothetical protein
VGNKQMIQLSPSSSSLTGRTETKQRIAKAVEGKCRLQKGLTHLGLLVLDSEMQDHGAKVRCDLRGQRVCGM